MIDPMEIDMWFREYLRAAEKFRSKASADERAAWARSMSLIADEFLDNCGGESAEAAAP